MWTVIYMTQNEDAAENVARTLKENNLIYKIKKVGETGNKECYEVLIPETEVNEAHNIIIENNLM